MRAKITKRHVCYPNGYKKVVSEVGEVVTGKVAEWAVNEGCAKKIKESPEETKRETREKAK